MIPQHQQRVEEQIGRLIDDLLPIPVLRRDDHLTGFFGGESYLLLGPGRPLVISDSRYEEELAPIKPLADLHIRTTGITAATASILADRRITRCAVQAEHLSLAEFESLSNLARPAKLIPTTKLVEKLRIIKDESEIALMKKATRIQEQALLATIPTIKPGQTELEIAAWLEGRPGVARVLHPALPSHPGHALWKRDFSGASGVFSIVLAGGGQKEAHAFLDALEIFGLGYSWGGYESLAVPVFLGDPVVAKGPYEGPLIRLQIGLEDVADLKGDLEKGLAAAMR